MLMQDTISGLALFMKNEDIDEAITHFKEAVTIDPKHLLKSACAENIH